MYVVGCLQLIIPRLTITRGRRRPENPSILLEKLLWKDRYFDLGGWCDGSASSRWLSRRTGRVAFGRGMVSFSTHSFTLLSCRIFQRLMGASLLIFLNKTDVEGCMSQDEVREVSFHFDLFLSFLLFDYDDLNPGLLTFPSAFAWMPSKHTGWPYCPAAPWPGETSTKDWNGWSRTRRTDYSCTSHTDRALRHLTTPFSTIRTEYLQSG